MPIGAGRRLVSFYPTLEAYAALSVRAMQNGTSISREASAIIESSLASDQCVVVIFYKGKIDFVRACVSMAEAKEAFWLATKIRYEDWREAPGHVEEYAGSGIF